MVRGWIPTVLCALALVGCGTTEVRQDPKPQPKPKRGLKVETTEEPERERAGTRPCPERQLWFKGECRDPQTVDHMFECPPGAKMQHLQNWEGIRRRWCEDSFGRKQGMWRSWYADGALETMAEYKQDHMNGRFVLWGRDSRVKSESHWQEGRRSGWERWWWDNRQKMAEGENRHGYRHGLWKFWDADGNPTNRVCYELGRVLWEEGQQRMPRDGRCNPRRT